MIIQNELSIKTYNTFGVDVKAQKLITIESTDDLNALIAANEIMTPYLVLGGGSNMLFTENYGGIIIHNAIKGRTILHEDDTTVIVNFGAGEVWHDVVTWTVEQGWSGIENLALIPGTVGAAPVQNIGAYGVELKDCFLSLTGFDMTSGLMEVFEKDACHFDYRSSIFKTKYKEKFIITSVTLQFKKTPQDLNVSYGAILSTLEKKGIQYPNVRDIYESVIEIRTSKLPDPKILGNAGSFFKNPIVTAALATKLTEQYPDLVYYPLEDGNVKVPAGWLIEKAGWKGKRKGAVGCHQFQALVIVNYGGATGGEIWAFAQEIQSSIFDIFGIEIQPEVNLF